MFEDFLVEVSPRFTGDTYNLLRWNCNNFSDELTNFLIGNSIPRHILAGPARAIQCIARHVINRI
jgi:hypothetical protein